MADGTARVERTGTGDGVRYYPSNGTVRYVAAWRHANPEAMANGSAPERDPVYAFVPFEEWVVTECWSGAVEGVRRVLERRADRELEGIGVGVFEGERLVVARERRFDPERSGSTEPSIPLDRLRTLAPDAVVATVTIGDRSASCRFPVRIANRTVRPD